MSPGSHTTTTRPVQNLDVEQDQGPNNQQYSQRDAQRQQLILLVEHLYHQIRYGCQEPTCPVPTCRTCRDRLAKHVPYRVPTPLTARAIASYLASLDDPYKHLCPHRLRPKTDAHDLAFATSKVLGRLQMKEQDSTSWDSHLEYWMSQDPGLSELVCGVQEIENRRHQQLVGEEGQNAQNEDGVGTSPKSPGLESKTSLHEIPIDTRSFAQRLYSTTTWRLASFIEIYGGKYRLLPPWAEDVFNPTIQALSEQNFTLGDRASSREPDVPYANLHPRIGVHDYPMGLSTFSDFTRSSFGRLIAKFGRRRYPNKKPRVLTRTSPAGSDTFLGVVDANDKHQAMLRLVSNIFSSPIELASYAMDPRAPAHLAKPVSRTVPLIFLVQEMVILFELDRHPGIILTSLIRSVQSTYLEAPPEQVQGRTWMLDADAAHIINVALAALIASVSKGLEERIQEGWQEFVYCRRKGHFSSSEPQDPKVRKTAISFMAPYQDELALYLMRLILRCMASRTYRSSIPFEPHEESANGCQRFRGSVSIFGQSISSFLKPEPYYKPPSQLLYARILLEWARSVFLQEWNGTAEFSWSSDVGCAVDFMRFLYDNRNIIGLQPEEFGMSVLFEKIDFVEVSKTWLSFKSSSRTGHLLSFPWLFPSSSVVTFFRAINFSTMFKSFEKSIMMGGLVSRMAMYIHGPQRKLLDRLQVSTTTFLVLEIRRDNILRDALNQLWRRQKRELLRPLKVRMGMDEGEEGFDLGGVQQEFFRLAIADALDPIRGFFTVDETTRMTWFLPCSPAPLHQYVLIGLLFGLAIYNGLTLPVTLPLALYRKLLDLPVTGLDHIRDGWPTLTKGFEQMLQFEGSVEEDLVCQYVFSCESQGQRYDVDMQRHRREDPWPSAEFSDGVPSIQDPKENLDTYSQDAGMVTNENRGQYAEDYIYWLTDKSVAPQFTAFATGFYLPLRKKALQLFTPELLQALVEGIQEIDVDSLRRTTQYEDGYNPQHPTVVAFWEIVGAFTMEERRLLLEFVTASDRVPVRGVEELTFIIQRNGVGDERLPSSATCFGRLLLPEYSDKEIMEQKLRLAIVNNRGFGYQ